MAEGVMTVVRVSNFVVLECRSKEVPRSLGNPASLTDTQKSKCDRSASMVIFSVDIVSLRVACSQLLLCAIRFTAGLKSTAQLIDCLAGHTQFPVSIDG